MSKPDSLTIKQVRPRGTNKQYSHILCHETLFYEIEQLSELYGVNKREVIDQLLTFALERTQRRDKP